ncbi:MAG: PBP1A family penicillin-binding protein [Pseudomonadota bacterium]
MGKAPAINGSDQKQPKPPLAAVLRAPARSISHHGRQSRKRSKQTRRGGRTGRGGQTGLFARLASELTAFSFCGVVGLLLAVIVFAADLPDTDSLWRPDRAPRLTILAVDGTPLDTKGTQFGAPIRLAELPPHVTHAVLAVEDRNFRHHFGVNPFSIGRALLVNASKGAVRQGGSTITQQLAKNLFLSSDRTIKRKVQELVLALWLENRFSKDEILTLYLNRVYLGAGAYGIDAASHRYFGKSATTLSLNEAALIAGLLKAPSRYDPTRNPADAGRRAKLVVEAMVDAGFISAERAHEAIRTPIYLNPPSFTAAEYFVDHARREVRRLIGDHDADLIVQTTFDPALQTALESGLSSAWQRDDLIPAEIDVSPEVAVVIADRAGAVRAMVGGRDYGSSQFNRATQSRRQPGSAFKPFIYLAAIEAGARAHHLILDAPITIGSWSPDNYKSKFYGQSSLSQALAKSMNSAAIRLQEWTGRDRVRQRAGAMGYPGSLNPDPALALGVDAISPYHLAQSWVPFANGGFRADSHVIVSVQTVEGIPLYQHRGTYSDRVASLQAINEVNSMLRAVVQTGTGRRAKVPGYVVAGKTGTTQGSRDAWFVGHADGLVGVVWLGQDNYAPMPGITGGRAPAMIWSSVMAQILPLYSPVSTGASADADPLDRDRVHPFVPAAYPQ